MSRRATARPAAAVPAVVFDTRVLLRALLRSDASAQALRQAWQQGRCQALVNPASARALMLALACPALGLSATQQHELLADFLPYATVMPASRTAPAGAGFGSLALALARSVPGGLLVSDSAALRARFVRMSAGPGRAGTVSLGSEEFLAGL